MQSLDSETNTLAYLFQESGFISHSLGAAVYTIFLILLLTRWRNRPWFTATLIATAAMIAWNIALSIYFTVKGSLFYVHIFEVAHYAAWYYLLMTVLGVNFSSITTMISHRASHIILLSFISVVLVLFTGLFTIPYTLAIPESGPFIRAGLNVLTLMGYMILSIIGLVLVEQVFMNTKRNSHWHIKFLCIGIATIFSYDFYVFSIGVLYQALDQVVWSVRGLVDSLAMPLIAISLSRSLRWSNKLSISRQFIFRSGTLLICAIYLGVVGLVGYYIGEYGGSWGTPLRIILFAGAIIVLILLVFSGRMRSLLRVLLNRHLFESNYDYRKEWIQLTQALSSNKTEEPLPERAIRGLADIVESPGGALWLRTDNKSFEQNFVLNMPWLDHSTIEQTHPMLDFLKNKERIIDVDEYRQTPDVYDHLSLPDWLVNMHRAWLVIPLLLHGELQGFMLLSHSRTKNLNLDSEDYDIIRIAGRQSASFLAEMQAANALMVSQQFEAVNRTSAFIVHDLKTVTAQLSLLIKNAEKHKSNPAFIDDMINTTKHSVDKMTTLIQQLRNKEPTTQLESINLLEILQQVIERQKKFKPVPSLLEAAEALMVNANYDQLASTIGHIIQNAQDATENDGYIHITLIDNGNGMAHLNIVDNGQGMDGNFIHNELFKPFSSTKGLTGMGIGVYQSRVYLRSIGGNITVSSQIGEGSHFCLVIPIIQSIVPVTDHKNA